MKKLVILAFLTGQYLISDAQPIVKAWIYEQEVLPGMVPDKSVTEEKEARGKNPAAVAVNYRIYMAYNKCRKIQPEAVWIRGNYYKVRSVIDEDSPVFYESPNIITSSEPRLLVPRTGKKLVRLDLVLADATEGVSYSDPNSATIVYSFKGKTYYKRIGEIERLEPVANQ